MPNAIITVSVEDKYWIYCRWNIIFNAMPVYIDSHTAMSKKPMKHISYLREYHKLVSLHGKQLGEENTIKENLSLIRKTQDIYGRETTGIPFTIRNFRLLIYNFGSDPFDRGLHIITTEEILEPMRDLACIFNF